MECSTGQLSAYLRGLRNHDVTRRGGVGVLCARKSKGVGLHNISGCELIADWHCLYIPIRHGRVSYTV